VQANAVKTGSKTTIKTKNHTAGSELSGSKNGLFKKANIRPKITTKSMTVDK
jgi:hypothetical protein